MCPSMKHLGVVFTKELKVAANCNKAYSKANRMLGLISRTIQQETQLLLAWPTVLPQS